MPRSNQIAIEPMEIRIRITYDMMIEFSPFPSSSFSKWLPSIYHPSLPPLFLHSSSHSKKHSSILIRLLIREISLITPPSPQRKQTRLVISVAASLVINLCPCKMERKKYRNIGRNTKRLWKEGSATREWQEEEGKKMEEDGGGRP